MKKAITLLAILASLGLKAQSFFTPTNYVGAFGTTDWTSGWANWTPKNTAYGATTTNVSGDITSNTTWTKDKVYLLTGFVYVKNGATLTIEAGTVIRGDKSTKGTLIITRGSKIMAEGTSASPIVFTSNQDTGSRNYGDWGGLVVLGKGKINPTAGTAAVEGGVDNANGDGQYGGTDNADNSGSLKFVRIEFPGIAFMPNSEINGLTLGAVGSGTTLEHIQVSYSGDDSYEWFGGAANAKWLIAFKGWDDDFDTDFGFSGNVQFGVSLRDSAVADQSGSNAFESDNDGTGSDNSPFSSALFCNMTVIGPKVDATNSINTLYKRGAHIRRNTRVSIYNSIITGFPVGLLVDGAKVLANLKNNDFQFENNIIAGISKYADTVSTFNADATFDVKAWFNDAKRSNRNLTNSADVNLVDPFNYTAPNFLPKTGSPALSGYSFMNTRLGGQFNLGTSSVVENAIEMNAFPVPANDQVTLNIELAKASVTTINILNIQGQVVAVVANKLLNAGLNQLEINTQNLSSGHYFLQINTNDSQKNLPLIVSHN